MNPLGIAGIRDLVGIRRGHSLCDSRTVFAHAKAAKMSTAGQAARGELGEAVWCAAACS